MIFRVTRRELWTGTRDRRRFTCRKIASGSGGLWWVALMPGSSVGALSRAKSVSDCTIAFIAGTAPGTTADVVLHRWVTSMSYCYAAHFRRTSDARICFSILQLSLGVVWKFLCRHLGPPDNPAQNSTAYTDGPGNSVHLTGNLLTYLLICRLRAGVWTEHGMSIWVYGVH